MGGTGHWEVWDPAPMSFSKVRIFLTLLGISMVENTEGYRQLTACQAKYSGQWALPESMPVAVLLPWKGRAGKGRWETPKA